MEIKRLESILKDKSQSTEEKKYAWEDLIATSNTEALEIASRYISDIKNREETDIDFFNMYSMLEGYEWDGKGFQKLYSDKTYHLCFSKDYFLKLDDSWVAGVYDDHPTWFNCNSDAVNQFKFKFGGGLNSKCGVCGKSLHKLIEFENIPGDIEVTELENLTLATCLSCLSWEEHTLSYQHGADSKIESLNIKDEKIEPEFPAVPLAETNVSIKELEPRWWFQSWASSNSRENLNRLGGPPKCNTECSRRELNSVLRANRISIVTRKRASVCFH